MSGLIRKSAVVATSAALLFGGITVPATGAGHGKKEWSLAKCEKHFHRWQKSHPRASGKQFDRENSRLGKHHCPQAGF